MQTEAEMEMESDKAIDWYNTIPLIIIHALLLFAIPTWSWWGFGAMLTLNVITGMFGICIGYHRLLTHGSFETHRWIRYVFAFIGGLAGEGSVLFWSAVHRMHHQFSDTVKDPHSPVYEGFLHSHMLWFVRKDRRIFDNVISKYAPRELRKDKVIFFLHRTNGLWHVVLAGLLMFIGWHIGGWEIAWSMLIWGMIVRLFIVLHSTWFVNSATHMFGYRNYDTNDDSRNCWWVALLTFGEGWHNNHHRYQKSAKHGHKWWEIDMSYWGILFLQMMGLAWKVHRPPKKEATVS